MASLNKFKGTWNAELAAHLFRRTTYGVTYEIIKEYGSKTLDEAINSLFQQKTLPNPPVNVNYADDPNVPIGQTWVDKGVSQNVDGYRKTTLRAWSYELLLSGLPNIQEKMVMFWHNHFVTTDDEDPRYSYKNITLIRTRALGNFKELTKEITIDPAMLAYLNGNRNTKQAPNENYARELLELFTLGKGVIAGPGDYTTYTETDIKEIAKVLTGWRDMRGAVPVRSQFYLNDHDTTTKKLSNRFNGASISNAGIDEYNKLIDVIFLKDDVSLFLSRKFYRWFVSSQITSEIENDIIKPMAKIFRDSNFEVAPVIKSLLESEHFYDICVRGVIVKNPIDFLLNSLGQFKVALPTDSVQKLQVFNALFATSNNMQMAMYSAPSVAGWQAYYQEPSYYRLWLNSVSLPARKVYSDALANTGVPIGTFRLNLNAISTLNLFPDPANADSVIKEFALILLSKPLASNQLLYLKTILASGSNDSAWTSAYNAYKAAPTDTTKLNTVVTRLRTLIVYMMRMPESHLS